MVWTLVTFPSNPSCGKSIEFGSSWIRVALPSWIPNPVEINL